MLNAGCYQKISFHYDFDALPWYKIKVILDISFPQILEAKVLWKVWPLQLNITSKEK